jgi:hypothetical protein
LRSLKEYNEKEVELANKIAKKLSISLSPEEKELLFSIERREFTTRRAFKIIELPFDNIRKYKTRNSLFVYKDVKVYDENKR